MAFWPGSVRTDRSARGRRSLARLALFAGTSLATTPLALGVDLGLRLTPGTSGLDALRMESSGPVGIVLIGLAALSATIALLHVRARRMWNEHFERQRAVVADLQTKVERAALFIGSDPQVFVDWDSLQGGPDIDGDLSILGEGLNPVEITNFPRWLPPKDAARLQTAVSRLRTDGQRFEIKLHTLSGALVEADGRPVAGHAVMRLRAVTGERLQLAELADQVRRMDDLLDSLKDMLNAIPQPVWLRDRAGGLAWVNAAYIRAVEAKDLDDVTSRSLDLLEKATRDQIAAARLAGEGFRGTTQVVVAGQRRAMDVTEVVSGAGTSGGIATDITELETVRRDIARQNTAHVRTLDQLPTAVALFDQAQRLSYYNRAFSDLWQLDPRFMESRPTDMEVLDRLRASGKLPEQSDFKEWKRGLQQSLTSNEALEDVWLLPNGQALRVVVSPSSVGGVTYLFDDITEQMHLAQNYNRLASMQGETLDALAEGVALFGSHGRLQLNNPAFSALWALDREVLNRGPHVDEVAKLCPPEAQDVWREIRAAVCSLPDERVNRTFPPVSAHGKVLSLSLTPLPEGASLLTVEDVTATVNEARILEERNTALVSAARFKSEFIHNVSFELRLPLTSVVGIAQLLATGTVGPLNERQRSYAQDLMRATDSVLALIYDILDLASIETTALELKPGGVDLLKSIGEAMAGLNDRLGGAGVELKIDIQPDTGAILGDERRIRQILYNLIANAVAFSDPGETVVLSGARSGNEVVLRIADRGSLSAVEDFGLGVEGPRRFDRGQSLRLSIVRSLVELHNGVLTVEARPDQMREVRCVLPAAPQQSSKATG